MPVQLQASQLGEEHAGGEGEGAGDEFDDPELANFREQLEEWNKSEPKAEGEGSEEKAGEGAGSASDADLRSIFVGNVDYSVTEQDLKDYFALCGEINRVTIIRDKHTGHPKGYAYVEFKETEALVNAMLLNETELRGRPIKVVVKRSNVPRHKLRGAAAAGRGGLRGRGGYAPGMIMRGGMMYMPVPAYGMPVPMTGYPPYPGYWPPRGRGGHRGRGGFRGGRGGGPGGAAGGAGAAAGGSNNTGATGEKS